MRYTASANSFLWYLFIPFLVIFYISFIFWSDRNYSNNPIQEVINKKQQAVNSLASIDGIILGGSNAQFGISAIFLNTLSNLIKVLLNLFDDVVMSAGIEKLDLTILPFTSLVSLNIAP